jgi:hypothetical protein
LNLRKKLVKCYIWDISFVRCWNWDTSRRRSYITGKFWNVMLEKNGEDQLDRWCEKIKKILQRVLPAVKRRKANWIGHISRRNCFLKHVTVGKIERSIEETGRRERRRKQLLDDL